MTSGFLPKAAKDAKGGEAGLGFSCLAIFANFV